MHKSNHHILSSCLVSIPHSWAAAACQHLLISKPTQCHFYGSTHWCTWRRERHCCFINSFTLAQLYPVQGFHSIVTMHFSPFSPFPPSFPACHSEQVPVFHLAVPAPQCHLAQDLTLPPLSLSPSPTLRDQVPAQQEQLSSVAPSSQRASQESHFESKLFVRGATPATAHGVFGAELEGEHSYFKSKCSVTAQ